MILSPEYPTERMGDLYHLQQEGKTVLLLLLWQCKENYTGSDCGIMVCEPRDDSTGHFKCDINGNKVCLPGYQNPETNCIEALNPITLTTISNMAITPMESISTRTTDLKLKHPVLSAHVLQI